jgi:CheY-like chemotaxis protein
LGLGLTLVKRLVELHQGTVAAYSAGANQGSEFVITLPVASVTENTVSSEETSHAVEAPQQSSAAQRALRLMVVDDNADAADLLASLLRAQGHAVSVYYTASGALNHALTDMPHAFLVDIGLPDMDGYELVQRLKAKPQTAASTFIAVSGYGQEQDKERSRTAGFHCHLVKPVDMLMLNGFLQEM